MNIEFMPKFTDPGTNQWATIPAQTQETTTGQCQVWDMSSRGGQPAGDDAQQRGSRWLHCELAGLGPHRESIRHLSHKSECSFHVWIGLREVFRPCIGSVQEMGTVVKRTFRHRLWCLPLGF